MKYEKCEYCLGKVKEKIRDEGYWYRGKLLVIKDVPVGVCEKCGEKYYKGATLEAMELIAKNRSQLRKTITVPITTFPG